MGVAQAVCPSCRSIQNSPDPGGYTVGRVITCDHCRKMFAVDHTTVVKKPKSGIVEAPISRSGPISSRSPAAQSPQPVDDLPILGKDETTLDIVLDPNLGGPVDVVVPVSVKRVPEKKAKPDKGSLKKSKAAIVKKAKATDDEDDDEEDDKGPKKKKKKKKKKKAPLIPKEQMVPAIALAVLLVVFLVVVYFMFLRR